MNVLFFVGDAGWTARARIFSAAAHGLAARGHEVTLACPAGPAVDRADPKAVGIVRLDPDSSAAVGTFDFRRVATERSLDVVFVHAAREQLIAGSGLRFARGGRVVRRVGLFEAHDDSGMITERLAPARLVVSTNTEAASFVNAGLPSPRVVPLGVDVEAALALPALTHRDLHLRDDAIVVACPYALNGRPRLLNVLRAVGLLAVRHPRLRVIVFGDRATDDDLRMQAAALGVAPLVQFIDGAKVDAAAVMKASDLVWVAADHDAGALGCLDAMAAGRTIIAERSPTIDHFMADGINGTAIPDGETSAIAAAVANAIVRADARAAQGAAGQARARREWGLDHMIDGFERAALASAEPATAR
jgi:glycosyltransferase involved in cell wall biosynthesis